MRKFLLFIATLGPIGYIPFAPGTFGTLAGFCSVWFFPVSLSGHFMVILFGTIIGVIAATEAEKQLKQKDSGKIIIDEFIGFYVAALSVPHTPAMLLCSFILFRFFDIKKPLMIKTVEKTLRKGRGVMADDIVAGIYANLVIQAGYVISRHLTL